MFNLDQCKLGNFVGADLTHIHGGPVRANGNGVRILKVAPMVDNLFGAWIDGETANRNHW